MIGYDPDKEEPGSSQGTLTPDSHQPRQITPRPNRITQPGQDSLPGYSKTYYLPGYICTSRHLLHKSQTDTMKTKHNGQLLAIETSQGTFQNTTPTLTPGHV